MGRVLGLMGKRIEQFVAHDLGPCKTRRSHIGVTDCDHIETVR